MAALGRDNFEELVDLVPLPSVKHRGARPGQLPDFLREEVEKIIANNVSGNGLLLVGPPGTGKTHTLYSIVYGRMEDCLIRWPEERFGELRPRESVERLRALCWGGLGMMTHHSLTRSLRSVLGSEDTNIITALRRAGSPAGNHVVMVDDYGTGYYDEAGLNLSLEEEWIDARYRALLPTYICTNASRLREWEGHERIADRVCDQDWMTPIVLDGKSMRVKPSS